MIMKKITNNSTVCPSALLSMTTSCKDYLDKSPLERHLARTDPYKNYKNFQGFTEELYNCIPMMSTPELSQLLELW
jgi:hypothetical protein